MGIDRRFVSRLLAEIEQHLTILEQARRQPKEQLFAEPLRALGVQHALQILIEAVITISHQLIAGLNLPRPERNLDAPGALLRAGVLKDPNLANRLSSMVRFRNLLVHRYWEVQLDLVYVILTDHLDDIREFAAEVSDFMGAIEHQA